MRRKALLREEREIQIINWFAVRIQHDNEDIASLSEIAMGLGLSPSSHLRKILEGMMHSGSLVACILIRPGRWEGRGYMLKHGTYQRPQKREIPIKFKVNGIEQMELI